MDKSMPGTFFVEIVAPSGTVFSSEATRFRAPGIDGSFEVLYNHAPLMAATGVGPVYVTTASGERITLVTSGGFVQVLDNRVIMIAETAEPASEIDLDRARVAEERARERLQSGSPEERAAAEAAHERARARVRAAMSNVGSRSVGSGS